MTSFKNRTLDPSKPIRAYRNLHRDSFSVVQDGLVVAHMDRLCIRNAKPHVNESGRQKVIQTRRKLVHAWIEGYICEEYPPKNRREVKYNPYKYSKFVLGPDGQEQALISASHVWLDNNRVFVEE